MGKDGRKEAAGKGSCRCECCVCDEETLRSLGCTPEEIRAYYAGSAESVLYEKRQAALTALHENSRTLSQIDTLLWQERRKENKDD